MKTTLLSAAVTASVLMLAQGAQADDIKGGAKADFASDELIVPCVAIEGYSGAPDGTYFDLVFDRRGKSFNYELKFAEPEDASVCEAINNFALFIDEDEDDEDDSDDDGSDGDATNLFASCEVRHVEGEQTRSTISVKAKDLAAGDYYAIVMSGDNTTTSETASITDDEVEFEFDSESDDVEAGAEAIEADFIVDKEVNAEFYTAAGDELLFTETVSCLVKD